MRTRSAEEEAMKSPEETLGAESLRRAKWIGAIFVAALALRIAAALRTTAIFNDGPRFLDIARFPGRSALTRGSRRDSLIGSS